MKRNTKSFDSLIFEKYGQDENYDLLRHNILNVRNSMLSGIPDFSKKNLKSQFEYCVLIGTIAIHTVLQHMDENRPLSIPENKDYVYSINRGWNPVKYIKIK